MKFCFALVAVLLLGGTAEARPHRQGPFDGWFHRDVRNAPGTHRRAHHRPRQVAAYAKYRHRATKAKRRASQRYQRPRLRHYSPRLANSEVATRMPHPEGCPSRAFCGCGVSLFVYGKRVQELYLASNWLKFPRAEPGPGKVAARPGHVMAILKSYGDGSALVYDPNSGRHQTKIRRRSLAGFTVVNPHRG